MSILLLGLNHRSAAVEIRERLAFDAPQVTAALRQLKEADREAEFVLLSTCNRVELYYAGERQSQEITGRLVAFLASFHGIAPEQFKSSLYFHENEDAVRHLLLVAAGLDSMVVGEAQILGQVKESYRLAGAARSTGKTLNRLFHCAFFTAKSVHTNTAVSNGRVSVAGVAVELARQIFADIVRAKVVVIGAGDTGELVVQHLLKTGCTDVTVVNRSYERGAELAARLGVGAARWEELSEQIGQANIVISSVAAQDYLYTRESFERTVKRRKAAALLIIDVGVPRNLDPSINKIADVYLYGMDELKEVAEQNLQARQEDIAGGLEIVYAQAAQFMDWFRAKDIGPLIGRMKDEFRQISRKELERFLVGPRQDAACRILLEDMVNRVVNKLLHCVIKNVDAVAKEAGPAEAAKLVDTIVRQAHEISCEAPKTENR
ncbi:MAG: glutamyl-tRNA reductase [Planctomycetes bacterium RBG_13_60_9]|nr:MAG: glutamyl-tRNA reductase [Planctomycetes bacterium RBG_13_60_9]